MMFKIILSCTLYILAIMCKKIPLPKQAKAIATVIYTKFTNVMGHCNV